VSLSEYAKGGRSGECDRDPHAPLVAGEQQRRE
jgi:hypothetical protein